MREVVKRDLAHPAGADPGRLDRARRDRGRARADPRPGDRQLDQPRGRPRQGSTASCRSRKAHGAALIALTIDEVGMAKTADRKVEIAKRIHELACDEHGLDPELLIFDALTFTLTTGDEEWKPSAVETIEGIRRIKAELPGREDLARRLERLASASRQPARAVLNSVFLHHCVEAGLDLAMVNPNHITPYARDPRRTSASSPTTSSSTAREDALERFIAHFESKGEEAEDEAGDPTEGMEPEEALHWHILRRKKDGRRGLDRPLGREDRRGPDAERGAAAGDEGGRRQVRRRRADPAVRAPVGRGDEARRRPARELPRADRGPHQGQGRDRDRVRRRARHRQVARQHDPHQQRLHGRRPRQAGPDRHDHRRRGRARGRRDRPLGAARLDLQADARLHPGAARARARVPGADRRRRDQPRLRPPRSSTRTARSPTRSTSRASSTARTPSRASTRWTRWSTTRRASALVGEDPRRGAGAAREARGGRRRAADHRRLGALGGAHRRPDPRAAVLGRRARSTSTSTRSSPTSTATCCSSSTGAGAARRARSGARSSRATTATRASRRSSSGCGASRTTCTRGRGSATSPATPTATSW